MASDVPEFCLRWNSHHSTLVSVLDSLLERERLCDVTLAAEGRFINVHRLVLFACSPYFEELLSQQPDKQAVVFLKDVRFTDLKNLIDYMYKGEVNVAQDQLTSFLQTAESLQIKGLVDKEKSKKSPGSLPEKSLNLLRGKSTSNVRSKASSPVNPPSSQVSKSSAVISSPPTTPPEESQFQVQNEEEQYEHRDMHGENEDNFVSVNTKHEDSELGMDDQFEATEHWNEEEDDDGWSNSHEGMSGTNTSDITIANTTTLAPEHGLLIPDNDNSANSTAGPSRSRKSKSAMANSTARGVRWDVSIAAAGGPVQTVQACPNGCGRNFSKSGSLKKHLRLRCGVEPSYRCPQCSYVTHFPSNLRTHMKKCPRLLESYHV